MTGSYKVTIETLSSALRSTFLADITTRKRKIAEPDLLPLLLKTSKPYLCIPVLLAMGLAIPEITVAALGIFFLLLLIQCCVVVSRIYAPKKLMAQYNRWETIVTNAQEIRTHQLSIGKEHFVSVEEDALWLFVRLEENKLFLRSFDPGNKECTMLSVIKEALRGEPFPIQWTWWTFPGMEESLVFSKANSTTTCYITRYLGFDAQPSYHQVESNGLEEDLPLGIILDIDFSSLAHGRASYRCIS